MDLSHDKHVPASERANARIVRETGDKTNARVPLSGALTIGREDGDVRVSDDPYLSHLHARVEATGDSYTLRDCGSTNGTFVQVRAPIELRPGDEIMIGGQLFRVVL